MNSGPVEAVPKTPSLYDEFLANTDPGRLQKILARYELFKLALDVPGDIVECGVFKGSGIFTWAKLMLMFKPNNEFRVIGFDFFGADRSGEYALAADRECVDFHASGWSAPEAIKRACAGWGFDRVDLYPGNVIETTARYVREKVGSRISLLYLDVDNYEGSLAILENLFPLVVPGGVVAFDEYALRGFGESDAVDRYFAGRPVRIRSFPWANTPTGFVIK